MRLSPTGFLDAVAKTEHWTAADRCDKDEILEDLAMCGVEELRLCGHGSPAAYSDSGGGGPTFGKVPIPDKPTFHGLRDIGLQLSEKNLWDKQRDLPGHVDLGQNP